MKLPMSHIDLPQLDLRASINEDSIEELADSMRDIGQLTPIRVRPIHPTGFLGRTELDPSKDLAEFLRNAGRLEVVFGSRRYRAARDLNWAEIDGDIALDADDLTTAKHKLIENVQREDLTPIEEAYGLFELIGDGPANIRFLQRQTGKSRDWIRNRLELLDLPEDVQAVVQNGLLGAAAAKQLGTIKNDTIRQNYLEHAITNGCTLQQATAWANQAEYAEVGMLTMLEHEAMIEQQANLPDIIEQRQNCFGCNESRTYRDLSMLTICRTCMDQFKPVTVDSAYPPHPSSSAASRDHNR
jgi:ParB/RepB/Spo0J family partition protein